MVIISHKPIREQYFEHPDWRASLEHWYKTKEKADWKKFAYVRKTFNSTVSIGNSLLVFNIKGNNCRLIARNLFKTRTLFIRFLGTYSEYNRLNIYTL